MAYQEASDLCTIETSDLEFVWLDKKKSSEPKGKVANPDVGVANHSSLPIPPSSSINNELGRRSFSPSLLSPNIPPNPPTSPVDGASTNRRRMAPQKLNVNAVPFVPNLGTGMGESVVGTSGDQNSSKNSLKTVRKLDFESAEDPVETDNGEVDSSGITWDRIECPILPRLPPYSSIQTSGQATSESRTTTVTDAIRESGQSQCRSHDDQACELMGVVSSTSPGVEPHLAPSVSGLTISPPSPLELPPVSLRSPDIQEPLLAASSSPSGQSQADSWPTIPTSPPPPIPLPPSHYHKTLIGEELPTAVISSPPLTSMAGNSLSYNNSNSIGDNLSLSHAPSSNSQQHSSVDSTSPAGGASRDGNETDIDLHSVPHPSIDSTLGPTIPASSSQQSVTSAAAITPPIISSTAPVTTPLLNDTITTSSSAPAPIPGGILPSTSGGGAWGSNRVKSWASVFKEPATPGSRATPSAKNNPKSLATPISGEGSVASQERVVADPTGISAGGVAVGGSGNDSSSVGVVRSTSSVQLTQLSEQLQSWSVSHKCCHLQIRGLVNAGNWCYVHAPLHALLSIPSMVHLFKSLDPNPPLARGPSATPFSDALCRFVHEFRECPKSSVPNSSSANKKKKSQHRVDLVPGDPFQPKYVYDMIQKSRLNLSYKGRQEDAEEFLGCLLDGLHEEMVAANRVMGRGQEVEVKEMLLDTPECEGHTSPSSCSGSTTTSVTGDLLQDRSSSDVAAAGGDEWEQVGPKNKSTITRQTSFSESPITEIFGGQFRSVLYRQGARESATMEPFFSLQLDIQGEGTTCVREAVEALTTKETVHLSEVDAYKRLTLARLPPVLVFHLKRFVFNSSSGLQKLFKFISYDRDMEIAKDLLAPAIKTKLTSNQRSYRLWAVVYHHGKTATGGHYTCDAYHSASGGWVRMDDALVKPIPEDFVLTPGNSLPNKTAYLLFYRRKDTIV